MNRRKKAKAKLDPRKKPRYIAKADREKAVEGETEA
ncbi:DUF2986 domain-containing protein [Pseudomaricurvus alkylphenolicus]|nr:DUF2986 domain-containing protein [Pseudomaricurvus alkylphenolicus]NIB42965.1 DUF2986 domain-containing protein [Pseudomaricurvus alkylphenolicus]